MTNDFKLPPLTGEQMYSIISNLGQRDGEVLKALNEEIERELKKVSFKEIAEQLQASLQTIDDDEIRARYYASGRRFYDQDDGALDSYKDRLEPFERKLAIYRKTNMKELELAYSKGIIVGLYEWAQACTDQWFSYVEEMPHNTIEEVLDSWSSRYPEEEEILTSFYKESCPEWNLSEEEIEKRQAEYERQVAAIKKARRVSSSSKKR